MKVLVTGGAGYIGAVLCRQLQNAGHLPVVIDRFFWGNHTLDGIEAERIVGDVRDFDPAWLEGVDAVCHLAGLSNDPTAEYNPDANWQMNVIATKRIVEACKKAGIQRFTFASSASVYDTEQSSRDIERSPIMCDETTRIRPRGAYSLSKHEAENVVLNSTDQSFAPVVFRQGTVYGFSPRMRFDLVVNTFLKDALLFKRLLLHGGGWMWRPLVDVEDVARVHVFALTTPLSELRGQIFNVMEENYQIRQLAMLVAGSLALAPHNARIELIEAPPPVLIRNYRMSNAKLSKIGFTPSITVLESIEKMLLAVQAERLDEFGHPKYYNIKWMTILEEIHTQQKTFASIY